MSDIYESCPVLTGPTLTLRLIAAEDAQDLLAVYGDERSVPHFNSDNCHGDTFHYPTLERMQQAVKFWMDSYAWRYFVRWSILEEGRAIGTIECFHRDSQDVLDDCGLLRIDLRRDRDTAGVNGELLDILLPRLPELFHCTQAVIKAPPIARARIDALQARGFFPAEVPLTGDGGIQYGDYWRKPLSRP